MPPHRVVTQDLGYHPSPSSWLRWRLFRRKVWNTSGEERKIFLLTSSSNQIFRLCDRIHYIFQEVRIMSEQFNLVCSTHNKCFHPLTSSAFRSCWHIVSYSQYESCAARIVSEMGGRRQFYEQEKMKRNGNKTVFWLEENFKPGKTELQGLV